MFKALVTEDLGLSPVGYAVTAAAALLFLIAAALLAGRHSKRKAPSLRQLAFCAMSVAVAYALSYVKLFHFPWGGSVTLCSMFFIVLAAYKFGAPAGLSVGFAYGLLQFLQAPYILSFFQVGCDYFLAFAALGVAGFFSGKKHGLQKGYIAAVFARGAFHALGGYLYWMAYMPDSFPKSLKLLYPVIYNYSYLLAEALLTLALLSVPAVSAAVKRVLREA